MPTLTQTSRYALRRLRRNLGFAQVVLITLGPGIGASTAIFSAVWRRRLPYPKPDQIAGLREASASGQEMSFADPKFADLDPSVGLRYE
jgi:hypothetical protein